ncbi:MAG: efflux RND transporter periplasmic adaptor subunit [Bryobacteraceae bacterium]
MEPVNKDSIEVAENAKPSERSPKRRRVLLVLAVLLAVAIGFAIYRQSNASGRVEETSTQASQDVYYCPMHPQQRSGRPGNCPICSMKLVKMETSAEGQTPMAGMETETAGAPTANAIYIAPEKRQLIGVNSVPAELRRLQKEIRTVGKIGYDETRITHIHTKFSGYIEEVFVDFIGQSVKRGQPLFTIYSPELVATQEEYLLAMKSRQILGDSPIEAVSAGARNLVGAARRRLRLWDISEREIESLERTGEVKRALTIYSPVSGVVTQRAAYHHGKYVTPETELYAIVDLSSVWALGEVYERDLPYVGLGQTARVEFPYTSDMPNRSGKVVFVSPTLKPETRTVEVRLEFPNPNLKLRPDMFVNFRLWKDLGRHLAVPVDAVLQTGTEQYVFVDLGEGYFEPRPVRLGAEADGYYAIESGLQVGELVVTAANFILDSESRLKGVFENMGKPSPVSPGQAGAPKQNLSIEVLEPKTAKVGANRIRVAVKDSSGKPVENADVQVRLFMPQMGSMPPMTSTASPQHAGKGVYQGTIDFQMAWTWATTITVRRDGQVMDSLQTTITAR